MRAYAVVTNYKLKEKIEVDTQPSIPWFENNRFCRTTSFITNLVIEIIQYIHVIYEVKKKSIMLNAFMQYIQSKHIQRTVQHSYLKRDYPFNP